MGHLLHDPPSRKRRGNILTSGAGRERAPMSSRPHEQNHLGIGPSNEVDLPAHRGTLLVAEVVEALDIEHEAIPRLDAGIAQRGHASFDEPSVDGCLVGALPSGQHGLGDDVDPSDVPSTFGELYRPPPPAAAQVKRRTERALQAVLHPVQGHP